MFNFAFTLKAEKKTQTALVSDANLYHYQVYIATISKRQVMYHVPFNNYSTQCTQVEDLTQWHYS